MQAETALDIKAAWGNKPCDHPRFEKEYLAAWQTGDHICTQCGRTFDDNERKEILASQKRDSSGNG